MRITPRYGGPAVLSLQGLPDDPAVPLLRQRQRVVQTLRAVGPAEWSAPSRCAEWSLKDVASHLIGIDHLWVGSFLGALQRRPTFLFADFDPVADPRRMVEQVRGWSRDETLDRLEASTAAVREAVGAVGPQDWALTGEAPVGHVPLAVVAVHALWDGWVHERDMLLPIGAPAVEERDEVLSVLCYSAGLGAALRAIAGSPQQGTIVVRSHEPDAQLRVAMGAEVVVTLTPPDSTRADVTGRAARLADLFSLRADGLTQVRAEERRLMHGLAAAFDAA